MMQDAKIETGKLCRLSALTCELIRKDISPITDKMAQAHTLRLSDRNDARSESEAVAPNRCMSTCSITCIAIVLILNA